MKGAGSDRCLVIVIKSAPNPLQNFHVDCIRFYHASLGKLRSLRDL
jgi:hypothetical protein